MRQHLVEGQPDGLKFKVLALKTGFGSPKGWSVWLQQDSGGCVEAGTNPMTVSEFKFYKDDLKDAIFVSAANAGHFPMLWQGGGHINIDLKELRKNSLLYRNFIIDLLNHNELFMGIFDYSRYEPQISHQLNPPVEVTRLAAELDALFDSRTDYNTPEFTDEFERLCRNYLHGMSFLFDFGGEG
jgi:hypothetical protein